MLDYNILQVVNVVAIQQHIMCACPVQFKKELKEEEILNGKTAVATRGAEDIQKVTECRRILVSAPAIVYCYLFFGLFALGPGPINSTIPAPWRHLAS